MTHPSRKLLPLVAVLAGAVALTPTQPPPAHAGSGGAAVAGAAAGFVMGVIVGRATNNRGTSTRSTSSRSSSSSRSASTRYVRDDATIQAALNAFGHDAGNPDGVFGPRTRNAIKSYQASLGETPTGDLSPQQRAQLLADYAALMSRGNGGGGGTGDGDDGGTGNPVVKTVAASDFLARLRKQGGDSVPANTDSGNSSTQTADSGDATTADGTTVVSFDEMCSSFAEQSTEGRVIDVSLKSKARSSDNLLLEQLCTARSYALQNLEADLAELGDLDIGSASEDCRAYTATQVEALTGVAKDDPDTTVATFEGVFGDVGDQKDAVIRSTRVCLGLAYAFDDPAGAVVTAASLTALGEDGYGELIGEHLAMGLGVPQNAKLAADWMQWTAAAIDEGARPVVDVEGYDRAPLLRVLAEVAAEPPAGKLPDKIGTVRTAGLMLPGLNTASRENEAVAFFAAESVAMIKSVEGLMIAIGLDRTALEQSCASGAEFKEVLSIRVCRALAYADRDFEGMYRYDQLLAEADDADAKTRLNMYGDLSEQGVARLVAGTN